MSPGDRYIWRKAVSNYGHIRHIPVRVLSVGPQLVTVETEYRDGEPERRVRVKPENLLSVGGGGSSGEPAP